MSSCEDIRLASRDTKLAVLVAHRVLGTRFGIDKPLGKIYVNCSASRKFWRIMDEPNEFLSSCVIELLDGEGNSQFGSMLEYRFVDDTMHFTSKAHTPLPSLRLPDLRKLLSSLLEEGRVWACVKSRVFPVNDCDGNWINTFCSSSLEDACSKASISIEELHIECDLAT